MLLWVGVQVLLGWGGGGQVKAAAFDVSIQNFAFHPPNTTISPGDSVTWTQLDPIGHTSTSDASPPAWSSQVLSVNQTFSFTFNTPGTYPFHCSPHPSMTGSVTVRAAGGGGNNPPSVSMLSPTNGTVVTAPANVTITAEADDADGSITQVEFFDGANSLGTVTTAPYGMTLGNLANGAHLFTAQAMDNQGLTNVSTAIAIVVNMPAAATQTVAIRNFSFMPQQLTINAGQTVKWVQLDTAGHTTTSDAIPPLWASPLLALNESYAFTFTTPGVYPYHCLPHAANPNMHGSVTVLAVPPNLPVVALTSPNPGAIYTAPATISLTASANETNGTISQVEFFANTTLLGVATQSPYSLIWGNVPPGTYTLTAQAMDTAGGSTVSSPVTVQVNAAPTVAIASPTNGTVFAAPANVTITATASDTDGSVAQVEFLDGTNSLGVVTTAPYTVTFANPADGAHLLTAKATDNQGSTKVSTVVTIVVNTPGAATQTVANRNFSFMPQQLTINAGQTVQWVQLDAAAHTTTSDAIPPLWASPLLALNESYAFTFTTPGVYPYHCLPHAANTNMHGSVTVLAVTPNLPVVALTSPNPGATYTAPATISLTASASETNGTISQVAFFADSTPLGAATQSPYTLSWANVPPGTYALTAQAMDTTGGSTISSPVTVQVNATPINAPPTVAIASPTNGTIFAAPANVTIAAAASDADGSVTQVEFLDGTNSLGVVTAAPYTVTFANPADGAHLLTAKATDNQGATKVSTVVTIVVNTPGAATQTVANRNFSFMPQQLTINAGQTVQWVQLDAAAHTTTSDAIPPLWASPLLALNESYAFTFTTPGVYPYHCLPHAANPNMHGAVTVLAVTPNLPVVSLTSPGKGAVYLAPASMVLRATATETNGAIDHVEFFAGNTSLGVVTQSPYTLAWNNVPIGGYLITAKAFDAHSASSQSAAVPVSVATAAAYVRHNLVSDLPGLADHTDANLLNPWGIAFSATGPFWLTDNHTGLSTVYDTTGGVQTLVVSVPPPAQGNPPAAPTGIVFNGGTNFLVGPNQPARFLFATEDGTISGWNNGSSAVLKVDHSAAAAIYKGLALGTYAGATYLYASDFHNGKVDVLDGNFQRAALAGTFTDPSLPSGYAPFGIQNLGGLLYVTYALQDNDQHDDVGGAGHGFVNVFDTGGNLLKRFASAGPLNSPWAVALAPTGFGPLSGALLIGNFADGLINAFDANSGAFLGSLTDGLNQPIATPGLWGLAFGNGGRGGDAARLYFAAGIPGGGSLEDHGLFGSISAQAVAQVALTSPTNQAVFAAPGRFNLQATAASAVAGIVKVAFYADTRLLGTATAAPYTLEVSNLAAGSYALTAQATDTTGAVAASAPVTVIVDQPPSVSILSPAEGTTYIAPFDLTVQAAGSDPDDGIRLVEFYVGPYLIGTESRTPVIGAITPITTLSNVPPGDYILTVKVTDTRNLTTTSAPVHIIATPPVQVTPIQLTGIQELAAGGFQFTIGGAGEGTVNIVQISTDLIHWTPIATNTVSVTPWTFSDPNATNYPQRFYRVLWP